MREGSPCVLPNVHFSWGWRLFWGREAHGVDDGDTWEVGNQNHGAMSTGWRHASSGHVITDEPITTRSDSWARSTLQLRSVCLRTARAESMLSARDAVSLQCRSVCFIRVSVKTPYMVEDCKQWDRVPLFYRRWTTTMTTISELQARTVSQCSSAIRLLHLHSASSNSHFNSSNFD